MAMVEDTPLLRAEAVSRRFSLPGGVTLRAVHQVSLDIAPREILGLVGESGSGKTTFGKTLIGLLDRSEGEVWFRDELLPARLTPQDFARFATRSQMIFQDPYSSLNPRMTVGEIIGEGLRLHSRATRSQRQERVADWLRRVGLHPDHMSRYPHEFSGGQRQRIGIARALILEPEFVVCDEPISALDVSVQAQVVNLLGELQASMGLTLLFIAHDLSMVRYVSDRMGVMYLGTLVELGAADEVFFAPKHPYTELLISSNPEPDPARERGRVHATIKGEIPSPTGLGDACPFAGRCPKVMDVCHQRRPLLRPVEDARQGAGEGPGAESGRGASQGAGEGSREGADKTRLVACHLYEDGAAQVAHESESGI